MSNMQLVNLSRQIALRHKMDMVANNIANLQTNGYKAQSLLMQDTEYRDARVNSFQRPDRAVNFVVDDANLYDLSSGRMEATGEQTDMAVLGDGWFAVETPDGERYTRNGSFAIAPDGRLVNRDGYPVLMEGGALTFDAVDTTFTVAEDGTVSTPNAVKGRLRVVTFANPGDVKKVGETLFEGTNPETARFPRIAQGKVERSNVNGVVEVTRMIEVSRAYEQIAYIMQAADKLQSDSISQLGQVA